jgi:acyl-CoA synthetase (AMP-forming)/AMP-acid ligase II
VAISVYGTSLAGGVFVPINPETPVSKLNYLLDDCTPRLVITQSKLFTKIKQAQESSQHSPMVLLADDCFSNLELETYDHSEIIAPSSIPNDLAALIYTSGSTGEPKGVMLPHSAMVFTAGCLVEYLRLTNQDRILCALPLSFDYGLYQILMGMFVGCCVVIQPEFKFPGRLVQSLSEERVTVFPAVPTTFATLLQLHDRKPLEFPHVQRITNTAAALPADQIPKLQEIFPNSLVFKMYGLTECKRVSYLEPELVHQYPSSVGQAIPGTEVSILNDDGEKVPTGETGILHVRGPHVMAGYWNKPQKTDEVLSPGPVPGERLLRTGDLFHQDDNGLLYFRGRQDDLINSRGQKVSATEIEKVLMNLNGIFQASVIGVPHPVLGQALRAFIVFQAGASLSRSEILKNCKAELESFQIPQEIIFLDKLPLNTNGKIDKKALLEKSTAK